jgi:integrase
VDPARGVENASARASHARDHGVRVSHTALDGARAAHRLHKPTSPRHRHRTTGRISSRLTHRYGWRLTPTTVASLRRAFTFVGIRVHNPRNPCSTSAKYAVETARQADWQSHLIVLLAGEAGLRCGEIKALRWSDVDLVKRQLCVQRSDWEGHVTATKGGRLRYVPLTMRLAAALQAHRHLLSPLVLCTDEGHPLSQRLVQGYVCRAARKAHLQHQGVHVLRHTFCSHLAMRGAPARAIQELAGHRDLATTQRYMHLSPAAIEGAIRLLDQPVPAAASGEDTSSCNGSIGKVLI